MTNIAKDRDVVTFGRLRGCGDVHARRFLLTSAEGPYQRTRTPRAVICPIETSRAIDSRSPRT
jgi:hypothetical protein